MAFKISTVSIFLKIYIHDPKQEENPRKADLFASTGILFLMSKNITVVFENKSHLERGGLPSEYFSEDCFSYLLTCDILLPID